MFGILALLFLVIPVVEIWIIIQVGQSIGGLETVGLLILISVVGAWLVRREGTGILVRVQQSLARGELPTNELIDGLLVLFAGALMLTPGFLTDAFGLLLLLPPTRLIMRGLLKRRFAGRVQVAGGPLGGDRFGVMWTDVRSTEVTDIGEARYGPAADGSDDEPPPSIEPGPSSGG